MKRSVLVLELIIVLIIPFGCGGSSGVTTPPDDEDFAPHIVKTVETPASGIVVSGSYAYVTSGGLTIIDINPPESAYVITTVDVEGNLYGGVAVSDGYAYVPDPAGLQIIDVEPAETAHTVNTVEVDAVRVAVSGNFAYVKVGDGDFIKIIDINPPESAYIVSSIELAYDGGIDQIIVSSGYAYVFGNDLHIIDIDPPETAFEVEVIEEICVGISNKLTIDNGYAYFMYGLEELRIFDVDPPESAFMITRVYSPYGSRGIAVSDGYAYTVGPDFQIMDIDPPHSAHIVAMIATPGYSREIAVANNYAYVCSDKGLIIIKLW